ncbi:endonuclease/exonuclease/phosphatase family protein [Rhizobium paknamense]|uniref:Endonuclease/exonuclease/phosphatase (EEP) superfamily protein YafD n=1 Tax=Rhizobium paknamense TaxID=1206817 RepID=A0ABU0I8D8_9HYPH|nr:endonuclease/exonuclease/phosphatase family protein [Rhizobium paknamense]MDQ0454496.1 endonuclease/exonuclease/phosphatase (EEP) superfamily protein YafD [Rhizobium paknamense]
MRDGFRHGVGVLLLVAFGIVCLRGLTGFWPPGFIHSLQLHVGLAMLAGAGLMALLRRGWLARLAFLAALIVTAQAVWLIVRSLPSAPAVTAEAEPLKVLSFNVLGDNLENGAAIADFIQASGADVAYVMEAEPVGLHLDRLSKTYPYRIGCGAHTDTCDLLLLSKYPLTDIFVGSLSDLRRDRFAMANINVRGAPLRLVAAHLSKPYFDDYHLEETEELADVLEDFDGPLLLAGDFNASILAPDMQRLLERTGLTTTGLEPATWPIRAGRFGVPIDHIFIRAPLSARSLTRIPSNFGSNHYGLMADLLLPKSSP